MTDQAVDVLVVGGGPGGSAAAIEGARRGLDVLVVDKATFPRDKCCGDGLTTGALRRLDDLGLDPVTVPSWQPVGDVHLRAPSGRERSFPLPADGGAHRSPGHLPVANDVRRRRTRGRGAPPPRAADRGLFAAVARRSELDAALVELARGADATVAEGHELIALAASGDQPAGADRSTGGHPVTATVRAGERTMRIRARYVVAADGMWSPTRKLLGLDPGGYRGEWHAFRQYFTGVDGRAARDLIVWFEPDLLPGYAWSFPVAGGVANVGFGILREAGRSVQEMKRLWPDLLGRPHVAEALGPSARPEAPHRAWPIPARLGRLPVAYGRVLFVGDALAAADPMTGEGIGQALETGQAAMLAVADHLGDPEAVVERYRSGLARGMGRDHRLARRLSTVLSSRRGAELALSIAAATGWTRRNFARWLFEDYPRAVLLTPGRWGSRPFGTPGAFAHHGDLTAGTGRG
jgi:flavin-dependent dehydrogenase